MHHSVPDHASHDLNLIAGHAAGDLSNLDTAAAAALLSSCGACAELHRDLIAISTATRALSRAAPAPRDFRLTAEQASGLAKDLAERLEREQPGLVVSRMTKSLRTGKVLIDWSQNHPAKTTITPYSLRGRDVPHVAAPRWWDEVGPGLQQLTPDEVAGRLADRGDPFG